MGYIFVSSCEQQWAFAFMIALSFFCLQDHLTLVTCRKFPLICLFSICNTPRNRDITLTELRSIVDIFEKYTGKLRESVWMHNVTGDCDLEALRWNLDVVITALKKDQKWESIIGNSVEEAALFLLSERKNPVVRVAKGM